MTASDPAVAGPDLDALEAQNPHNIAILSREDFLALLASARALEAARSEGRLLPEGWGYVMSDRTEMPVIRRTRRPAPPADREGEP